MYNQRIELREVPVDGDGSGLFALLAAYVEKTNTAQNEVMTSRHGGNGWIGNQQGMRGILITHIHTSSGATNTCRIKETPH